MAVTIFYELSYVETESVKYYRRPTNHSTPSQPSPSNDSNQLQSSLSKQQSDVPSHREASLPDRKEVIEAVTKINAANGTTSSSSVPPHVETDGRAPAESSQPSKQISNS